MEASPPETYRRRLLLELAGTAGALAALALAGQLRDSTSPLRLRLAAFAEAASERAKRYTSWRGRRLADALIEDVQTEEVES